MFRASVYSEAHAHLKGSRDDVHEGYTTSWPRQDITVLVTVAVMVLVVLLMLIAVAVVVVVVGLGVVMVVILV